MCLGKVGWKVGEVMYGASLFIHGKGRMDN